MNEDTCSWSLAVPPMSIWACSSHFCIFISLPWAALPTLASEKQPKKGSISWLQFQWRQTGGKPFADCLSFSTFCLRERHGYAQRPSLAWRFSLLVEVTIQTVGSLQLELFPLQKICKQVYMVPFEPSPLHFSTFPNPVDLVVDRR